MMLSESAYETHPFWKIRRQTDALCDVVGSEAASQLAHVVLEDDNYDDEFITSTLNRIEEHGFPLPDNVTYQQYKAIVGYLKYLLTLPEEWRERPEYTDMIDPPQEIKGPGNFYYGVNLDTKLGPLFDKKVWDKDRFNFDE